jgi:hypothetical protein
VNGDAILAALELPEASLVGQRIPKKLLLESGAPTSTDRRYITEGVEEMLWVAALKPATIGVFEYRDAIREYLEIAVLRLALRATAKAARVVELVHRAVPYPVLLLTELSGQPNLSAAHKRWSQAETGKTVLEDEVVAIDWDVNRDGPCWPAFAEASALRQQPHSTLWALYQGWIDTLLALQAARLTGNFVLAGDSQRAHARRDALREYALLDRHATQLRAAATKERQMPRRVELNLELKRVQAALSAARARL